MILEVKKFIEQNKDLIADNKWDQVYDNAVFTLNAEATGELGITLLSAGIDPLKELDYIPENFLNTTTITEFNIPKHIHLLSDGCFAYCYNLKQIVIPDFVTQIDQFAFYACDGLRDVFLPEHIHNISLTAFDMIHPDAIIHCKQGTVADKFATEQKFNVEYI